MVAGVTVALLLVPQSMAYADLAGLPPEVGLYASFLPVMLGAMFGSCRQLGTGPVAMTSILTASILAGYAEPGDPRYLKLAFLLTCLLGLIRILMGLARLAALVNLLSQPVLAAFTNAAAMIIGLSQVNKIFGLPKGNSRFFGGFLFDIGKVFSQVHRTHLATLCFGVGAFALIYGLKKWRPKWPAMLIATVLATLASWLVGFESKLGGTVVGHIPAGLPRVGLFFDSWTEAKDMAPVAKSMIPSAIALTIIGFMEAVSVSKAIALKTRQKLDLNQELIGQGVAAIGSGLSQGYPVSGSFSRSAMNLMCGAKTGMSSVFTALVVMLVLLFLTPLLYHLPTAVLAAGIMVAVFQLIRLKPLLHAWRASGKDGFTAVATWLATLLFAPSMERGIFVGVSLALVFYLKRTMAPPLVVVGVDRDGSVQDANRHGLAVSSAMPAIRLDGSLYFGSVAAFEDSIMTAVREFPQAKAVLIICDGMNFVDASGDWCIRQVWEQLQDMDIGMYFAGMKHAPYQTLLRTGLVDEIGRQHFVRSVEIAKLAMAD
jgi:SulP family sulfate permease